MYAKYKIKILTIDSFITRFVNSNIYPRKYQKAGLQLRFFLKKLKITRSVLALSGIKIGEIFPKFSLPLYRIRDRLQGHLWLVLNIYLHHLCLQCLSVTVFCR